MGLIKVLVNTLKDSVSTAVADQFEEYFYCNSLDNETLAVRGTKKNAKGNNMGDDNVISNGSIVTVADGQCMMIVEQGKIVEVCAEPGEYKYDTSTEPSIFSGKLGKNIIETFKTMGKRFAFGGEIPKDQRVYYFNTKELMDNKFGTPNPVPFRVVDSKIGLDIDVSVRCSGVYSYKIANPLLFYTNVCGNFQGSFTRDKIETQLKTEFISALQPALGRLSALEIRPSALVAHNAEVEEAMNNELSSEWGAKRGLEVVSVAFGSVTLPDDDAEMIKQAQMTAIMRDPTMAAAHLTKAQGEAMKAAAENDSGAMMGFMGMNMAQMAGGMNAQNLFAMGQQQQAQKPQASAPAQNAEGWVCSCGTQNNGNFCHNCGGKKPEDGWVCLCGSQNKGNFCPNCGNKKPASKCANCGYTPDDLANPPKFCPDCGNKM